MPKSVVVWIVEEEDKSGQQTFLQTYDTYDEALFAYNFLKEDHKDRQLSIQKSEKKLLVEG